MDTSEQYINMCEEAGELQAVVNVTEDIVYASKWNKLKEERYSIHIGREKYRHDEEVEIPKQFLKHFSNNKCYYIEELIWLPRQDQLQQLLLDSNHMMPVELLTLFYNWVYNGEKRSKGISLEALWLMYYMRRTFNKEWNKKTKQWINPVW